METELNEILTALQNLLNAYKSLARLNGWTEGDIAMAMVVRKAEAILTDHGRTEV